MIGSLSSSPRFHTTFDTRRRRASPFARSRTAVGPIDGNHPRRPARRFDRQITFPAAEIGDVERRQQLTERPRPGRPAPPRHELPRIARIGAAVRVEVLLAQPQHFLQARLVGANDRIARRLVELLLERRPQGVLSVVAQRRSEPVIRVAGVLFLDDQARVLQQAEVPGHARLRETENSRELGDVQALTRQDPQQPEPRLVAEQPVERGRLAHINKSTFVDDRLASGYSSRRGQSSRSSLDSERSASRRPPV